MILICFFFFFCRFGLKGFGVAMDLGFQWVLVGSGVFQWDPVGSGEMKKYRDHEQVEAAAPPTNELVSRKTQTNSNKPTRTHRKPKAPKEKKMKISKSHF